MTTTQKVETIQNTKTNIRIRFFAVDYSDFWSRLIHYGVTVTQRGNEYIHCTIEIGDDGYDLTFNGLHYYDATDAAVERLLRMKAKSTILLSPMSNSSISIVRANAESVVDSDLRLEPHELIDWIYGNEEVYFCTDFVRILLEISNPGMPTKTPVELYNFLTSRDTLVSGTGIYDVIKEK